MSPDKPKLQFSDHILARTVLPFIPERVRPNWFTTLRILLAPFVALFVLREQFVAAIGLFVLASLTDFIDGALARTRGQITNLGKVLDPIADKLLIGVLTVTMVWIYLSSSLAVIIVAIEFLFIIGGFWRLSKGIIPSANWWGKIKFNFQVLGVIFLFASVLMPNPVPWETSATVSFTIAIMFAILSLATQGF